MLLRVPNSTVERRKYYDFLCINTLQRWRIRRSNRRRTDHSHWWDTNIVLFSSNESDRYSWTSNIVNSILDIYGIVLDTIRYMIFYHDSDAYQSR